MQSHESLLKQIYDIQLNNLCGIFFFKSNLMSDGGEEFIFNEIIEFLSVCYIKRSLYKVISDTWYESDP